MDAKTYLVAVGFGRTVKSHAYFSLALVKRFAGRKCHGYLAPTFIIYKNSNRSVSLSRRLRIVDFFLIALVLAAHGSRQILLDCYRLDFFQQGLLGGMYMFAVQHGRFVHGDNAQDLQQVALDEVAQSAKRFIKSLAAFNADFFLGANLDAGNMFPAPQRLENRVAKTESQDVLDSLFGHVVVDAENLFFLEDGRGFID